jgi:cell division protein FtsW (lipid II flippase)
MRHINFITIGLTLALSVMVEILSYVAYIFFGKGDQPSWFDQAFAMFHYPAVFLIFGWVAPDTGVFWQAVVWVLFIFSVAVLQWWLIILAAIWLIRHFRRRHEPAA